MKQISVVGDFPKHILLDDYHEVKYINDIFIKIGIKLKAEEVGFGETNGRYICKIDRTDEKA